MSDPAGSREAASFCAELVRSHDFVRYASTLFVPAPQRRALLAVYAFNVEVSRVHEQVSQPLPGEMRLQWWTDTLAGVGHGGVEGNPVAAELLLAIQTWRLPVERLSRLIEEHQFDLYNDPMPTMAALEGYINDTSSVLFSLAAQIAGQSSEEIEHLARHAGLAQGMAQVMASLPLRRFAAPIVRAAAGAGEPRLRDRGRVRGQGNPEIARPAGSAARRGAGASEDGSCLACDRSARGAASVPAAGAGATRSCADVACRQRSLRSRDPRPGFGRCGPCGGPRGRGSSQPEGEFRSAVSKLNRSRKFLRCSRMFFRNARSVSLVIIGSIRSS